jgi:acetyl esterase/lipase
MELPIEPAPGMALTESMRASLTIEERWVPGPPDAPDVRVVLYRQHGLPPTPPLIVNLHGGAFRMRADHFPAVNARLAKLGALVMAVDYRTLPAGRFPAAPDDCYAALCWAVDELEIDRSRVVVTGTSVGGNLAAALTLMARDRGGPAIAFQALVVPALDNFCETVSVRQFEDDPLFGGLELRAMWRDYLHPDVAPADVSPYAAPSQASDLSGLPPAFVQVGGLDPLRDEGMEYAIRLLAAGVPVELYCAPGQHHGLSDDIRIAVQAGQLHRAALAAALA